MPIKIFPGIQYQPVRELSDRQIITIAQEENMIYVLIKNYGDHPTLLTIDFLKNTYDVEGYD